MAKRTKTPWKNSHWETTQEWQKIIQELEYDMEVFGLHHPLFRQQIRKFFDTTLGRR